VATTTILADVTANVASSEVQIETLIPADVDPHDFNPSSEQGAILASAAVVISNGLGLESGIDDLLEQTENEGVMVVKVGELVDPLPISPNGAHEEEVHAEEGDAFDPHFWQDPLRMVIAVDQIADALRRVGLDATGAESYKRHLIEVDEEIVSVLSAIPEERRVLVTNHDAFSYFADRYGFNIIGTVIPGTDTRAEPSSQEMADLVSLINEHQVPAIFVESIASPDLAESLAAEADRPVAVVPLVSDALGEAGTETSTYTGMLLSNAKTIAEALAS
jgi:zinc/manganese transport system substrate-binding protein